MIRHLSESISPKFVKQYNNKTRSKSNACHGFSKMDVIFLVLPNLMNAIFDVDGQAESMSST